MKISGHSRRRSEPCSKPPNTPGCAKLECRKRDCRYLTPIYKTCCRAAYQVAQHSLGEAHDYPHFDRGQGHRQEQALLRHGALEPFGYKRLRAARTLLGYGYGGDSIAFWVVSAERPVPADEKSGLHFCFAAPNPNAVDAFHAAALRAGGRDNGAPGLRPQSSADYYAAFIIDPDGYRIEAYCGPAET